MTESQQKLLELLPRLVEKCPKTFEEVEGDYYAASWPITEGKEWATAAPALIVEAVRLELLTYWPGGEHPGNGEAHLLRDFGGLFEVELKDKEGLYEPLTNGYEYDIWDGYDRARAACDALLEVVGA